MTSKYWNETGVTSKEHGKTRSKTQSLVKSSRCDIQQGNDSSLGERSVTGI